MSLINKHFATVMFHNDIRLFISIIIILYTLSLNKSAHIWWKSVFDLTIAVFRNCPAHHIIYTAFRHTSHVTFPKNFRWIVIYHKPQDLLVFLNSSHVHIRPRGPRWWHSGLERLPRKQKVGCSNLSRDRPKSLKQEVTTPLPNARQ